MIIGAALPAAAHSTPAPNQNKSPVRMMAQFIEFRRSLNVFCESKIASETVPDVGSNPTILMLKYKMKLWLISMIHNCCNRFIWQYSERSSYRRDAKTAEEVG